MSKNRNRYLFSCLILIGLLAGCSERMPTEAARPANLTTAGHGTEHLVIDNTNTPYWVRVTIGTITILCVADYPSGFMGPLPEGHCRTEPSFPRDYVAQKLTVGTTWKVGDPDAGDLNKLGDPDEPEQADNDGIVLKSAKIGDPTGDDNPKP